MKAKCPFCTTGCAKCKEGYIEVTIAKGLVYDLVCRKCRSKIGFHINNGDDPLPNIEEEGICCVTCQDPQDLEWVLVSYSEGGQL